MKKQSEAVLKQKSVNTKTVSKDELLKEEIKRSQQKLYDLKNKKNPQLLQKIREIQKQINRLQILTIGDNQLMRNFLNYQNEEETQKQNHTNSIKSEQSNEEKLLMLKNITSKNFQQKAQKIQTLSKSKGNTEKNNNQFSPHLFIKEIQQKSQLHIMETQIYPLLNRYLIAKSSLLTKINQLNPEKRHNNSLLIPHQRVLLKEHLDLTRKIIQDINKNSQQMQNELNKDFIVVKNKWEESERQLIKLSKQ